MTFPMNTEDLANALDIISTFPKEEQDEIGKYAATLIRAMGSRTAAFKAAEEHYKARVAQGLVRTDAATQGDPLLALALQAQQDPSLLAAAELARQEGYIPAAQADAIQQQLQKDFGGN